MGFFLSALLYVGLTILGEILRPKPRFDTPSPSSLDDFDFPTAQEGRPVPVLWGTAKITGANCVWYGDLQVVPIVREVRTGLFSSEDVTIGYRYEMGADYVLCHGPLDSVTRVLFDDKLATPKADGLGGLTDEIKTIVPHVEILSRTRQSPPLKPRHDDTYIVADGGTGTWIFHDKQLARWDRPTQAWVYTNAQDEIAKPPIGTLARVMDERRFVRWNTAAFAWQSVGTEGELNFDLPTLFGGPDQEGGIGGRMRIHYGDPGQTANAYLQTAIGATLPAWPGLAHVALERMWIGNSPYVKTVAWVATRYPNSLGLTGAKHKIGADANGACCIYEAFTNAEWGLGYSSGSIDVASFRAAGDTLWAEGQGLSMYLVQTFKGRDLVDEVLRIFDGVLFRDPQTGLWTLKLVRNDYDPATIPVLDRTNVETLRVERPDIHATLNMVRVLYTDRKLGFVERPAPASDLAQFQLMGGQLAAEDIPFLAVSEADQAQEVAARALMQSSYPFAPHAITANRKGWDFRPGSVFKLNWDEPGQTIVGRILRVARFRGGRLLEGKVSVDALEDLFAVGWVAYDPPPPSGWVDPSGPPVALLAQSVVEAPMFLVQDLFPPPWVRPRAMVLGSPAPGITLGYEVHNLVAGSSTVYELLTMVRLLTPSAVLAADVTRTATSLVVNNGPMIGILRSGSAAEVALGRKLLMVDQEIVAWQTIVDNGNGTFTIGGLVRGQPDTTPGTHTTGARVWFLSEGHGIVQLTAEAGIPDFQSTYKLPTFNPSGRLPLTSIGTSSVSINSDSDKWRVNLPYVPSAILVNGASYPATIGAAAALTVAWTERDRMAAWSFADAGATPTRQVDVTVVVKVHDQFNVLFHTEAVPAGTSTWTLSTAQEIAESGRLNTSLRVVLYASYQYLAGPPESGDKSFATYDHTVTRA